MERGMYFVGVDIGGTKTYVTIEDEAQNQLLFRYYLSEHVEGNLAEKIQECVHEAGVSIKEVAAMGVGVPGCVDKGVVIDAPGLGWKKYPLAEKLQIELPFPVFLNNDVRMALIGEKYRAGQETVRNMAFIAIGTGLGCAFLANGSMVTGQSNSAGEIGYFICRQDAEMGLKNARGEFGTMESYVSGTALNKAASEWNLTAEELFSISEVSGHPAKRAVDSFVRDLSMLIANVISLLDPEVVVLGGGVSESLAGYIPAINKAVRQFTPLEAKIAISKLGSRAGVLGACEYGKSCYLRALRSQRKKVIIYEPNSF